MPMLENPGDPLVIVFLIIAGVILTTWLHKDVTSTPLSPRAKALLGSYIIAFDCRGCMAHDHQFMWLGRVVDIVERDGQEFIVVERMKARGNPHDYRDMEIGQHEETVADGALQELGPGLWVVSR